MIVNVNIRSATVMLAIHKFVTQVEDLFKTTNNPIELPSKAMVKITAYTHVMPILNSWDMPSGTMGGAVDAAEETKIAWVRVIITNGKRRQGAVFGRLQTFFLYYWKFFGKGFRRM